MRRNHRRFCLIYPFHLKQVFRLEVEDASVRWFQASTKEIPRSLLDIDPLSSLFT